MGYSSQSDDGGRSSFSSPPESSRPSVSGGGPSPRDKPQVKSKSSVPRSTNVANDEMVTLKSYSTGQAVEIESNPIVSDIETTSVWGANQIWENRISCFQFHLVMCAALHSPACCCIQWSDLVECDRVGKLSQS